MTAQSGIEDAMRAIDQSGLEIALAVEGDDVLIGIVTDGDIRRALLRGAALDSPLDPVIRRDCTVVSPSAGRAEVLDLMKARRLRQIPVIDEGRRLVGLHLLHEILGLVERPNWAVVMAGGRGTRLTPLTDETPKPMLRVAGRPILERIVLHLVGFGIRRIFLSVHHLAHLIEEHFGDGKQLGCSIEYLREPMPLGTGGCLALLPAEPSDPVVVMNGDLVTQVDLGSMLDLHTQTHALATVGVHRYHHPIPFGCVDLDGTRVLGFEEKPTLVRPVNAGIYVLEPKLLSRIPKGRPYALPDLLEACLARGEAVHAYALEEDWIDVGQHSQLRKASGLPS